MIEVSDLSVRAGGVRAVDEVSFSIEPGRRLGLIGESGSGKTLTALAIMGLLPDGVTATGSVRYRGDEILHLSEHDRAKLRGEVMGMVFQEPLTALNPVMRIGEQIAETLRIHRGASRREGRAAAGELLRRVQMPDPEDKLRSYPHQLSGGQRQRVVLAIAIACSPELVIADEPTTALDVTVQAEILRLLDAVTVEQAAFLLITHDLPVVSSTCDEVLVMYGGRIVERGPTDAVFARPRHPYTAGLLDALPDLDEAAGARLRAIPGTVPALGAFPSGCVFRDRCERADGTCAREPALTWDRDRAAACWHPLGGPVAEEVVR
ncbi:ABC transporter ATP-binding protein [Egibacter rhizosphaerae]|uniref:ABC transporter ATP-binding protein n=1 Tax=Egibacter rhizosphaerae TaxID=1670831 RepID=A0A411YJD5_9ACTN|nr:ABC transporter ATP-binding protein [Egibacter rhizosphaerae]QBI21323.1 ABC transporter ATP-binding protein [Egibacter rhizosphaerae]